MELSATRLQPPATRIRVLLIDDSKMFLGIMFEFVSRLPGVEVVGFTTSARDAMTTVEALRPDLIVVDLMMPDMNGLEATAMIRQLDVAPKIIMVSGHNDLQIAQQCTAAGADAFIAKEDLHAALPETITGWFPEARDQTAPAALRGSAAASQRTIGNSQ